MSQKVVFTDADTTSDPLYISASIAEEQNELPSVIDGLRINANGELILPTQKKRTFFIKGDTIKLMSNEPVKPGTSWSINIKYGDKAGNNNVSSLI